MFAMLTEVEAGFNVINIFLYIAIILVSTKSLGMLTRKIGLPQVVGMVIAGLLIGPAIFGNIKGFGGIINPSGTEMAVLDAFAQIGVVLILFSSGLETKAEDLKKSGLPATLIACAGVAVPICLGTVFAMLFMGNDYGNQYKVYNAVFVGLILAATSVGITVETLRELGKLNTRVGTTVLNAAIIDDVIGILVLSIFTSITGGGNVWITILKTIGFFACAIGVGALIRMFFRWLENKYQHKRRNGIFALCVCLFYAYSAEKFFGIASITGAYMAGIVLCGLGDTPYIEKKILVSGYMIFTPIFFAYIGISADFSHFQIADLLFGLVFVFAGVIAKIVGCGLTARLCKYKPKEALTIGCGMIARGEVALAVYTTGKAFIYTDEAGNLLGIDPLVGTIMLIVISSILCPILLKLVFKDKNNGDDHKEIIEVHEEVVHEAGAEIQMATLKA